LLGDAHARDVLTAFEELAEERLGRGLVATALDQDVKEIAVLIHRPPERVLLTTTSEKYLIPMVLIAGPRAPELMGVLLAERPAPCADHLIGHDDPACEQPFFDITIAGAEVEGEPDPMADDCNREMMRLVMVSKG
jgi:hypothetical protein